MMLKLADFTLEDHGKVGDSDIGGSTIFVILNYNDCAYKYVKNYSFYTVQYMYHNNLVLVTKIFMFCVKFTLIAFSLI